MSQLNFQSPVGALDTFPFTPDAPIFAQEVNNMLEQVRAHINGNIGVDNFELPFTSEIPFNITSGSALSIDTSSGSTAFSILHDGSALTTGNALFHVKSVATNIAAATSLVHIEQDDVGTTVPLIRLQSNATAATLPWVVATNGATEFWSLSHLAAGGTKYTTAGTEKHSFVVGSTEKLAVENGRIFAPDYFESNTSFRTGFATYDNTSLTLEFGGAPGPTAFAEDSATLRIPRVRIGDGAGPRLSYAGSNNNLLVEDTIQFNNITDGPKLSRDSANVLRVNNALRIHNGSESVLLTGNNNKLNVDSNSILANGKAAVVAETGTALKIIRGTVTIAATPAILSGEGFTITDLVSSNSVQINFSSAFSSAPSVVVSSVQDSLAGKFMTTGNITASTVEIHAWDTFAASGGDGSTTGTVCFIAIGPR